MRLFMGCMVANHPGFAFGLWSKICAGDVSQVPARATLPTARRER
jgi:hypothetical protein